MKKIKIPGESITNIFSLRKKLEFLCVWKIQRVKKKSFEKKDLEIIFNKGNFGFDKILGFFCQKISSWKKSKPYHQTKKPLVIINRRERLSFFSWESLNSSYLTSWMRIHALDKTRRNLKILSKKIFLMEIFWKIKVQRIRWEKIEKISMFRLIYFRILKDQHPFKNKTKMLNWTRALEKPWDLKKPIFFSSFSFH